MGFGDTWGVGGVGLAAGSPVTLAALATSLAAPYSSTELVTVPAGPANASGLAYSSLATYICTDRHTVSTAHRPGARTVDSTCADVTTLVCSCIAVR